MSKKSFCRLFTILVLLSLTISIWGCSSPFIDMRTEMFYFNNHQYDRVGQICVHDRKVAYQKSGSERKKVYSIVGDSNQYFLYIPGSDYNSGLFMREDTPDPLNPSAVFIGSDYIDDVDFLNLIVKLALVETQTDNRILNYSFTKEFSQIHELNTLVEGSDYISICYDGIAVPRKCVGKICVINNDFYFIDTEGLYGSTDEATFTGYRIADEYYSLIARFIK